jgi:hypothetical protein
MMTPDEMARCLFGMTRVDDLDASPMIAVRELLEVAAEIDRAHYTIDSRLSPLDRQRFDRFVAALDNIRALTRPRSERKR